MEYLQEVGTSNSFPSWTSAYVVFCDYLNMKKKEFERERWQNLPSHAWVSSSTADGLKRFALSLCGTPSKGSAYKVRKPKQP